MQIKKTIIVALLLISSIGIAIAAIADISGNWTGPLLTPDGKTAQLNYVFKADGTKLTGTGESVYGTGAVENGKIAGNEISFDFNLNGVNYPHKGKLYPDSIALAIDYSGTPLHVTLKRLIK